MNGFWPMRSRHTAALNDGSNLQELKSILLAAAVRSSGTVHFAAKMHEQINSFVATSAPDKQMVFCADRIAVLMPSHFSSPDSVSGLIASIGHSGSQTPLGFHLKRERRI